MAIDYDQLVQEKKQAIESDVIQTVTYLDQISRLDPVEPFIVRWAKVRPALIELAGAAVAEGKGAPIDIYLINKTAGEHSSSLPTMIIGFRIIPPHGESHRPVRLLTESIEYVIEGNGFTRVNGEQFDWGAKDMIVIPSGAVREYGNANGEPAILFFSHNGGLIRLMNLPETRSFVWEEADDPARFLPGDSRCWESLKEVSGPNVELLPALRISAPAPCRPFLVKWQQSWELLEALLHHPKKEDPRGGKIVGYVYRAKGNLQASAATLVGGYQIIQPGFKGMAHAHSMAAIQLAALGRGYSVTDGRRYEWEEGDILIFPPWCMHEHGTDDLNPAVLFGVLDNPLIRGMRLQRVTELEQGYQEVIEVVS
ncbi:MAG: cupin domain-containing protein [Acidobacteria bacterium]|nr:MAG: cupin domain-containing protein [Acidobacteriota bacterium]